MKNITDGYNNAGELLHTGHMQFRINFVLCFSAPTAEPTRTITLKVKVKVKFTLEQATKAQRGSRGIAILFL
jgi:hypothetical protein